ncbi:LysR substrate-binding domain-containing protein [Sulfitobacter aestuarii]|uniref:LysR substrate-binding domain-containing protein n=1 Tax=Sulfitobacter aestuarii TaxID=2161676 RepID=A0ABW5U671_9RHOB
MDGTNDILRNRFLQGMSHAACTVNIVTTDGPAGRAGVTVSAMASVSADSEKPTLLICVHHLSPAAAMIVENGVLCVNVLRDDQSHISDTFAGRFKDEVNDKFECADWIPSASGAPQLSDPLVAFDCTLLSSEQVGTHHIFLCEVQDLAFARHGSPLIYARRAYGTAMQIDGVRNLKHALTGNGVALKLGCFHAAAPYILPQLIAQMPGIGLHLVEGDQRRLCQALSTGECDLALMYDIDLPDALETDQVTRLTPYVLLPDGHPLASQTEILPQELAGEPMVLLEGQPSRDYFTGLLTAEAVTPNIAYRSTSFEMVRGLVAHGLGYALLVTQPACGMSYDGLRLVSRPLVSSAGDTHLVLARRKGAALPPVAQRFAALSKAHFNEAMAYDEIG